MSTCEVRTAWNIVAEVTELITFVDILWNLEVAVKSIGFWTVLTDLNDI